MPKSKHWFVPLPPEALDEIRSTFGLPPRQAVVAEICFHCAVLRVRIGRKTKYRSDDGETLDRMPPCDRNKAPVPCDQEERPSQRILAIAHKIVGEFQRASIEDGVNYLAGSVDNHIMILSTLMFLDELVLEITISDEEIRLSADAAIERIAKQNKSEAEYARRHSATRGVPS